MQGYESRMVTAKNITTNIIFALVTVSDKSTLSYFSCISLNVQVTLVMST